MKEKKPRAKKGERYAERFFRQQGFVASKKAHPHALQRRASRTGSQRAQRTHEKKDTFPADGEFVHDTGNCRSAEYVAVQHFLSRKIFTESGVSQSHAKSLETGKRKDRRAGKALFGNFIYKRSGKFFSLLFPRVQHRTSRRQFYSFRYRPLNVGLPPSPSKDACSQSRTVAARCSDTNDWRPALWLRPKPHF